MKPTRKTTVVEGSGNVFAELDLPNSDDLQTKAELSRQLYQRIKALGLSQVKAAKLLDAWNRQAFRQLPGLE